MKSLILVSVFFHILFWSSNAQNNDDLYYEATSGKVKDHKVTKRANVIIIEKNDSAQKVLKELSLLLLDKGFSIEKYDKELFSITTDFKRFKFGGVAVMKVLVTARQNGNKTILKLRAKIEVTNALAGGQVPFESCYCGLTGDAKRNSFIELINIADSFSYDSIEFKIE